MEEHQSIKLSLKEASVADKKRLVAIAAYINNPMMYRFTSEQLTADLAWLTNGLSDEILKLSIDDAHRPN